MERGNYDDLAPAILERIGPADWAPPAQDARYDLVVLGGGALGVRAAEYARALGARVAVASDEPLGIDVFREGLPRARLTAAAAAARQVRAARSGVWPAARLGAFDFVAWRREVAAKGLAAANRFTAARLARDGIHVLLGPLVFQGPNALRVGGRAIAFSRALLASPLHYGLPAATGLAEVRPCGLDRLGRLETMPRRWAILGGAAVACELAQTLSALGGEVELITAAPSLLFDETASAVDRALAAATVGPCSASKLIERRLIADGVRLRLGWRVLEASRAGAAKGLLIAPVEDRPDAERQKVLADEVLVVGERRADLEWLRLDLAGVAIGPQGVVADGQCQTANPAILAVAPSEMPDILDDGYLAALARLAVDNALQDAGRTIATIAAPRRLSFDPPITCLGARVAWHASDGQFRDETLPVAETLFSAVDQALRVPSIDDETWDRLTLRIDTRRDRLLAASLVGAAAQDLAEPLAGAIDAEIGGWREFANDRPDGMARLRLRLESPPTPPVNRAQRWWRRVLGSRARSS